MRKILFATFFILLFSNFAFSQNKLPELEKLKKIKIFESTQKDVQKILPQYIDKDSSLEIYSQVINAESGYIMIAFSEGNCGEDENWNVAKGLVTGVSISNLGEVKVKDLGFNLKTFKKEIEDKDYPKDINYHDEKKGIFIRTEDGEVESIVFYPPNSKRGFLCSNENNAEIISGKQRLVDTVSVIACILIDHPPVINNVVLSETELFANKNKVDIEVKVNATDPEGSVLTYNYTVSSGKIIGQGETVIWDLTDAEKGTHTIIVTIDDGCGVCAAPMSKTVFIK